MNVSVSRRTQEERREQSRTALLESAARHLSTTGYANLVLEAVARDAGYTRGALYHQFASKEELTRAVLAWVDETWQAEVGEPAAAHDDPLEHLLALAHGHAVFCRRDIARFGMALRIEFSGQDVPLARESQRVSDGLVKRVATLVTAGRRRGTIPLGPPPRAVALAYVGALEGAVITLAGRVPHDATLAVRAVRGVLGV